METISPRYLKNEFQILIIGILQRERLFAKFGACPGISSRLRSLKLELKNLLLVHSDVDNVILIASYLFNQSKQLSFRQLYSCAMYIFELFLILTKHYFSLINKCSHCRLLLSTSVTVNTVPCILIKINYMPIVTASVGHDKVWKKSRLFSFVHILIII